MGGKEVAVQCEWHLCYPDHNRKLILPSGAVQRGLYLNKETLN